MPDAAPADARADAAADADAILGQFLERVAGRGLSLYPAQEEALLAIMAGHHVILATPTGSGKSLVAEGMHHRALALGERSIYTCPIKALVNEKFFALCAAFGPERVGMLTGDASINRDAPIVCCTAEVLANMALASGSQGPVRHVVMDEFHYYADAARGMAWQLPLLLLPQASFLLMSATLGPTHAIEAGLEALSSRPVSVVRHGERPVPLDYTYVETPLHETLGTLARAAKTPVYVVHFTQADCVTAAQAALSQDFLERPEKQEIAAALGGFRFDSPFGREVRRLVSHGVGIHHAGLLPKYRLLVEKLAQRGLLKIIMGTDTLGVGVNVPIRTVLFTKLCKFDGSRTGILTVRDFRQVAGRAGRQGFDTAGSVLAQAPEHVIENLRLEAKVGDNPAKRRKMVKKKPPTKNYVPWDRTTFARLTTAEPEPLVSQFKVTHALLLALAKGGLAGRSGGFRALTDLIARCHDSPGQKRRHRRQAATVFRSLREAGVLELVRNRQSGTRVTVRTELQDDFSLHQSLALYLLDVLPRLDRDAPDYALDVISMVEAILDSPQVVLNRQAARLRNERLAELRAAGAEYEERQAELEKITFPKPLADFCYATFNAYAAAHPWVGDANVHPKSIVREIIEHSATFAEYVRDYGLERSEGVLLRYLSGAVKALEQTVPEALVTDALEEATLTLRALVTQVDRSLIAAWEEMRAPAADPAAPPPARPRALTQNPRALRVRIRTEMHRLVAALARQDWEEAAAAIRQDGAEPFSAERLALAMAPYFARYGRLRADPQARQPQLTVIQARDGGRLQVQQILLDPEDARDWAVVGTVELDAYDPATPELPLVSVVAIA